MNIAELAILSPMPIFPDDPFWDGQPRESNGRFAAGKMPGSYLRCSSVRLPAIVRTGNSYDDTLSALNERFPQSKEWRHTDVGDFLVSPAGLRHALRTFPSRAKTIALWHLDDIIPSVPRFHDEPPHKGKKGILNEKVGSVMLSVGRHTYLATVTIELPRDGVYRFHHLRLDAQKKGLPERRPIETLTTTVGGTSLRVPLPVRNTRIVSVT